MHPKDHAVPIPILYSGSDPPKNREEVQADLDTVEAAVRDYRAKMDAMIPNEVVDRARLVAREIERKLKITIPADQYEAAANLKRKYKGGKRRRVW